MIACDAWLVAFNRAIDGVMASNQKARSNPKALHTLDGYKRGLVNSLTGNLQWYGFDKAGKSRNAPRHYRRDERVRVREHRECGKLMLGSRSLTDLVFLWSRQR